MAESTEGRGRLTDELQSMAREFLGREIDALELRLYPYLQYVMVNDRTINPQKINSEERAILRLLKEAGHMEGGMSGLAMTREFWDFICGMLWVGYATYDCRELEAEA